MIFHIPRSARTGNLKVVLWNPKLCASLSVEVRLSFWYSTPSGLVMVTMRSPETGFKVESRRRVWTITKVKKSKRPKMKVYTGKEQCRWCVYLSVPLYKQACQFEWELVERKSYSLVCDLQTNEGPGPSSTYTRMTSYVTLRWLIIHGKLSQQKGEEDVLTSQLRLIPYQLQGYGFRSDKSDVNKALSSA